MKKTEFKQQLIDFLTGAKTIAILAVGNELKADDIAGLLVAQNIKNQLPDYVYLFNGESLPENFTAPIRRKNPTHVLLIDAAEFEGGKAGEYGLFEKEQINNFSFTTHTLPLSVFIDFLQKAASKDKNNQAHFKIIGIQPKTTEFDEPTSVEVKHACEEVATILLEVFTDLES